VTRPPPGYHGPTDPGRNQDEIPYGEVEWSMPPPRVVHLPLWKLMVILLPALLFMFTVGLLIGLEAH
jgi:hypothetical protein